MSKKALGILALSLCSFFSTVAAKTSRFARVNKRKIAQLEKRAALEEGFKRFSTLDLITSAQQESATLTRDALSESWSERNKQKLDRDTERGRYAHMYPMPAWPQAMQCFVGNHSLTAAYTYQHRASAFDEAGSVVDPSVLRFGGERKLRDLLLASKMVTDSGASAGSGHEFLEDLAAQPMPFQSVHDKHVISFSYTLGMFENKLQLGLVVPLQQQIRTIRLIPEVTTSAQAALRDRSVEVDSSALNNWLFREYYGLSVTDMMEDIIRQRNMIYQERLSQASVGEVSFFAALNFFPWRLDRWTVSGEVIVPGVKSVDWSRFYPFIPESQGVISGRFSTGFVGRKTLIGSPHFKASFQVYAPASIVRRVPRMVTATSASYLPETEVYGDGVLFDPLTDISEPETVVADFASQTVLSYVRPGFVANVRAGSVITPFISPLIEADFYYSFTLRGSDELRAGLSTADWYTQALLSKPYRAEHRLGCALVYAPNKNISITCGVEGVVAGRNVPIEIALAASISGAW